MTAMMFYFQVNCGWTFNRTRRQWVDLGIQTQVCIGCPETCGTAGGAISVWLRVIDCESWDGFLSSASQSIESHFYFGCIDQANPVKGVW